MTQAGLDTLAWVYVGLSIGWTLALAGGLYFLYLHRRMPFLQIRKLPLLFLGIISLHIYGILCCLGYVIGAYAPCTAEFWVMSIYLPFGYAMFHAANSQFLHVASRQKQFTHLNTVANEETNNKEEKKSGSLVGSRFRGIIRSIKMADGMNRLIIYIGIGLLVQLLLALFIFFGSKKFHPGYGIFDYEVVGTQMEVRMKCSKGWEWWITIIWQLFWTWIYAPYTLWKSRNIHDVHGWRLQTICCCLAGLPSSPLWLSGLYLPQMAPVNKFLVPPFWFSISIFFMEIVTIGFPIVQVFKTKTLRKETLDAIASWEDRYRARNLNLPVPEMDTYSEKSGAHSGTTTKSSPPTTARYSVHTQKLDMLTMAALENALRTNPEPLLQFAALKDFSGENVSFLTHVADWKRGWFSTVSPTTEHRQHQFLSAVRIYATFVSLEFSEFPINISSPEIKRLDRIFESAATILLHRRASSTSTATPFDQLPSDSSSSNASTPSLNLDKLGRANLEAATHIVGQDDVLVGCDIPDDFSTSVFDTAEAAVKYLVLTNTWPKFVHAGRPDSVLAGQSSVDESEQGGWRKKYFSFV